MSRVSLCVLALLLVTVSVDAQSLNTDLPAPVAPAADQPPPGSMPPEPSATAKAAAEAYTRARWSFFLAEKMAGKAVASSFCEGTSLPADMCKSPSADKAKAETGPVTPIEPAKANTSAPAEPRPLARLVAVVRSDGLAIAVYDQDSAGGVERFTASIEPGETTRLPDGRRIQSVTVGPAGTCVSYVEPHAADCLE